jgi:L-asparaginase/Glu-tRNA(Gln) amidotransferase subunit D
MFPGISEAVLEAILNIPNLGIVLETYGAGNAPTEDWFLNLRKNFNRFTYRKCDTMLWRKCQYGTI